ncbi:MAG: DUF2085 domain-containing protein [Coriobacteriales bacterium]|jgi:uncharacterized membrane protein|nr:DUF2085 domain-containing protein [Coriobacteriales bacterium]
MLDILQQIVYFFGRGLCHQYTSRSLEAGGIYFGVCARDTGIYLGLVFTIVAICLLYARGRTHPSGMPPSWTVACCALLMVPMILDGISSYSGMRETTNLTRYITGYLCGSAVGILAAPALLRMWRANRPELRMLAAPGDFIGVLCASYALGALFFAGYHLLGVAAPLLVLAAELAIATGLNLLILLPVRETEQHTRLHRLAFTEFKPAAGQRGQEDQRGQRDQKGQGGQRDHLNGKAVPAPLPCTALHTSPRSCPRLNDKAASVPRPGKLGAWICRAFFLALGEIALLSLVAEVGRLLFPWLVHP